MGTEGSMVLRERRGITVLRGGLLGAQTLLLTGRGEGFASCVAELRTYKRTTVPERKGDDCSSERRCSSRRR